MSEKKAEGRIQGLYNDENSYYFVLAQVLLRETHKTKRRHVSDGQEK